MGRRGVITDYAGEALYPGDLVTYATRRENRVRMTDAVITLCEARKVGGRLRPMLKVTPTGDESGFAKRVTFTPVWVAAEHVRLVLPAVAARD